MTDLFERLEAEGYFSLLDVHFARTMCDICCESDIFVLLGAATASRFVTAGHVCMPVKELAGSKVWAPNGPLDVRWPEEGEWIGALTASSMVGKGDPPTPLVLENGKLYLHRYWQYESSLAENLAKRVRLEMNDIDKSSLEESLNRQVGTGPSEYRSVLESAATSGLTVISGGPGTGKTSAVVAILATMYEQAKGKGMDPPRVVLLAPTGKAAARLAESIQKAKGSNNPSSLNFPRSIIECIPDEASTIHRALGTRKNRPTTFVHGKNNPLSADVVVVDEASMVDIALMAKLEAAVPEKARLILIGDKNQLASVEAGAVLGEINIPNNTIHLTKSYRFDEASGIGTLAKGINAGQSEDVVEILVKGGPHDIQLIEPTNMNEHYMTSFLETYVSAYYVPLFLEKDPARRLELFESFRILTAHREGIGGVSGINRLVLNILRNKDMVSGEGEWYDGRPVIVTENDYDIGLFNGDVAIACNKPNETGLLAHFYKSSGIVNGLSLSRLPSTETAFALTVHKAQGSEFEEVLVVLPPTWSPVVTRQLLYTAVTRARKRVTLLASKEVLHKAISTPTSRAIGLHERLKGLL